MTRVIGIAAAGLLAAGLAVGTLVDVPTAAAPRTMGDYHVLATDFHVHSFPFSWSTLSPWDTVVEARRQGLDAIAMTPHNHVWVAKVGRWFAGATGGPLVLVGEEIASARYHMLAVGITEAISPALPAARAIEEAHRQGGIAIAAHPYPVYWPAYDAEALSALDAAEIVRPESQHDEAAASLLRQFFARTPLTAIGSSDYHGFASLGYSRTYVFVRSVTEHDVLDAVRAGRTVVYDRDRAYGDPVLIQLAAQHGGLPNRVPDLPAPGAARLFSRAAAIAALVAVLLFNRWQPAIPA